jgi:hypothetical protein
VHLNSLYNKISTDWRIPYLETRSASTFSYENVVVWQLQTMGRHAANTRDHQRTMRASSEIEASDPEAGKGIAGPQREEESTEKYCELFHHFMQPKRGMFAC